MDPQWEAGTEHPSPRVVPNLATLQHLDEFQCKQQGGAQEYASQRGVPILATPQEYASQRGVSKLVTPQHLDEYHGRQYEVGPEYASPRVMSRLATPASSSKKTGMVYPMMSRYRVLL